MNDSLTLLVAPRKAEMLFGFLREATLVTDPKPHPERK